VNNDHNPTDRQAAIPASTASSSFSTLFGAGIFGWLLGVLGLLVFAWSQKTQGGYAGMVMWAFFHGWIAFLIGLVFMIGWGIATGRSPWRAAFGFLLPACLLALVAGICLLIYPNSLFREDLLTYLPMVVLFYVFGLLWARVGEGGGAGQSFTRATLPAIIGGLVVLCFVAAPVFASDAFRYRDAFRLSAAKTGVQDGVLQFEGSLEIRKPGSYRFSAPRYLWEEIGNENVSEPETENGEFVWGAAGAPAAGATGVFPVKIIWRKGVRQTSASVEAMPFQDSIHIEITTDGEPNRVIFSLQPSLP
jgi:hypothetical protein